MAEDQLEEEEEAEVTEEEELTDEEFAEEDDGDFDLPGEETDGDSGGSGVDPILAALASFILPGAGQILNGETLKGIILLALTIFSGILMMAFIGFLTTPLIVLYAVYDAYKTAEANQEA